VSHLPAGDLAFARGSGIVVQAVAEERTVPKLLVATNNPGKVREYEELLDDLPVEITFPAREGLVLEVEESGDTFEENARLKALAYAHASGLLTLRPGSHRRWHLRGGDRL
jgi:XTP/dITP diphosphohydrolase